MPKMPKEIYVGWDDSGEEPFLISFTNSDAAIDEVGEGGKIGVYVLQQVRQGIIKRSLV